MRNVNPATDIIVTIKPAITTPIDINMNAFLLGIPNSQAANDPVHAPVIGKGIATKIMSANGPYFLNLLL